MLNKRFKIAKCKTSLKLATSRIKLMKNKKGPQINQIKRDLAQLLESGQDRTARIRVEHVIREEKMVAAYDLIEIYCELIVARLPIIESQKSCPIDLKEAITSVIFAAPRCSDIPELLDVRKHFTAKYGKEFISAAIELRPDCGVSRMLVEKLSATAPDVQTKMKVLSAVAKEHNINWDPTSFEEKESKPPDDLLNGPINFEKASLTNVDPPKIQTSNVHDVQCHEENPNAPFDFSQQNKRYTLGTQNITSVHTGGIQTSSTSTTHDDMRSSGMASERMNMRQSFHSNGNDSSSGRENWNMEFKDATSAAQAAAESAERASIAARAAAQLSSQGKITRQYSTEPHESYIRDKRPQVSATSEFPGQRHFKDSYNSSFNDRNPKIQNQQMGPSEGDTSPKANESFYGDSHGSTKRSSRPASLRSRNDSVVESSVNNFHQANGYFENSSHEDQGPLSPEMSRKKESKAAFRSGDDESSKSASVDYFAEGVIRKQPSLSSPHSHSSTISDELDVSPSGQPKVGKRTVGESPFAVVDQGDLFRETTKTSSYVDARRDDETDSDDDGPRFDTGFEYDEREAKSYFPSPGRESIRPVENTHIWSPRRNMSDTIDQVSAPPHLFSERHSSEHSAKPVDPLVLFDLSDGPDSESEREIAKSSFSGTKKFTASHKQDLFSTHPEPAHVESSQKVNSRKSRIELNDLVEGDSSFYNPEDEDKSLQSQQSSTVSLRHESKNNNIKPKPVEDNSDFLNQSDDLDTGKELKFGTLTGGLRNKGGLKYPPYTKSAVTDASPSSKKSVDESPETVDQTSQRSSFSSRESRSENKKPSVSMSSSESDSDDHSDKFPVQSSKTRSRFAPPDAFFDDDGTDSEEEIPPVPKQTPTSRVHLGSGLSRRTKGSPSAPYYKGHAEPVAKTVISSSNETTRTSRHSYTDESPAEPRSYAQNFKKDPDQIPESSETSSTAAERKPSRRFYSNESPPMPRAHTARSKQEAFRTMPEPKISEQPPYPPKKIAESGKTEASKTSNLSSEISSEANNVKKPSHVHPMLPDYDSLAARIQALRTSLQ